MRILNADTGRWVCHQARWARSWWARTRGLIGAPALQEGQGLLIDRCDGVHMFFMRYAIDVIFLDEAGQVVALRENLRPWRMTRLYRRARRALELPVGAVAAAGVEVGHQLRIEDQ